MEVTWLGGACFRLRGRDAAVATDPHTAASMPRSARPKADLVTLSEELPADAPASLVRPHKDGREPFVVSGPGEYEVAGVYVHAVAEDPSGARSSTTLFTIEIDRISVGYVATLNNEPSDDLLDALGAIHVLLINVEGQSNGAASDATLQAISRIEPNVAVPFGPRGHARADGLEGWRATAQELSGAELQSAARLVVTRNNLPDPTSVQVIEPRGQ